MGYEFALSFNNRSWMPVHHVVPAAEQLQPCLSALDGGEHASLILAPLPAGKPRPEVNPWKELQTYMQAAGSSDRMTIEIRQKIEHRFEQLVVGRPAARPPEDGPTMVIEWDQHSVTVREGEVFAVDEALRLFSSYLDIQDTPPGYVLRPLA